jgi:hypothetical protein
MFDDKVTNNAAVVLCVAPRVARSTDVAVDECE